LQAFLDFNVLAVGAVDVFELLRRLRWSPEMMREAGIGVVPMPTPYFPAETWSRSME
jgi:hypothetical protein